MQAIKMRKKQFTLYKYGGESMKKADFLTEGDGVLRLKPTWVPRSFCRPGKRIKLHPDDYFRA